MDVTDFKSLKPDLDRRMNGAIEVLHKEFSGLRTGRAAVSLLDPVMVDAYGAQMPLNQVGTVSVPEPRMITVQVWDKGLVRATEKAIMDAGLGLNPSADGQMVRIPIPQLTEERRIELTKVAGKYAEDARIAVRNVRRHGMDELKKMEKDGHISKDQIHDYGEEIQSLTDSHIKDIDTTLSNKEQEVMQV